MSGHRGLLVTEAPEAQERPVSLVNAKETL